MSKNYIVECHHPQGDNKKCLSKTTSVIHVNTIINYLIQMNLTTSSKMALLDKVS